MKDIIFSDGKLTISISDIITFIYTKNDTDMAYIGSILNHMVDTLLQEENILVKSSDDFVELTIMPVIKKVTLVPIKSNDLVHYLMHQIKCMNENLSKITNIINHNVKIDCVDKSHILIGSKCLEFIFTKEPKISTSHINHTTIYFDISNPVTLNTQVSLVKSNKLIVSCDCSENIVFSWKHLPETINNIVFNDIQTCSSFIKNIVNVTLNMVEIEFKKFVVNENILDAIVDKWPHIMFRYNDQKFNYEKIEI